MRNYVEGVRLALNRNEKVTTFSNEAKQVDEGDVILNLVDKKGDNHNARDLFLPSITGGNS